MAAPVDTKKWSDLNVNNLFDHSYTKEIFIF